jgi:biotin carboxyl carrier protein
VLRLDVKKGVRVSEGDTLLVLESMKMEHPVRSPLGGMVQAVHVASGETVAADALLVEIR